ncbi:MAG: DUF4338 domain-containing protein [Candidatus Doudnabacteria bacterium]|nr:DUF4338 domain-containing protein [Candidatus Doudnabacteria bacterium]
MDRIICKCRGREIRENDLAIIREIIVKYFSIGRKRISQELSKHWQWYQPNGQLKDMACREILLRLERTGYIKLPPGRHNGNNQRRNRETTDQIPLPKNTKEELLQGTLKNFLPVELKLIKDRKNQSLWNALISRYHYQGYHGIVGACLKYLCYWQGKVIACLGWGSAAWNVECRDKYIGWSKEVKDKKLPFIVNNIRFLILPGVKVKYLASHLLSLSVKQVPEDWQKQYGHSIYLLETFVEKERFRGTCYKAANWIYVGETKGYSKRGSSHYQHRNIKDVYVYLLCRDFRGKLMGQGI